MRFAAPIVLLAACGRDQDPADTAAEVVDPSPYVVPGDEEISPKLDQGAIEQGLADAITRVIRYDARPVTAAYLRALSGGDSYCPAYYTDSNGNTYWASYCRAESGTEFDGYGYYYDYAGMTDESGNIYDRYVVVSASSSIAQADGTSFEGSGYVVWTNVRTPWGDDGTGQMAYATVVQSYISGSWVAVEPDGETSWITDGVTPETSMYLWLSPDGAYSGAYVTGGISHLGASVDTVSFESIVLNGYWACSKEPAGAVSIRDDDGYWYDVFFDVDENTGLAPENACDGCGQVWYRGVLQGQACADFSTWYAWKDGGAW